MSLVQSVGGDSTEPEGAGEGAVGAGAELIDVVDARFRMSLMCVYSKTKRSLPPPGMLAAAIRRVVRGCPIPAGGNHHAVCTVMACATGSDGEARQIDASSAISDADTRKQTKKQARAARKAALKAAKAAKRDAKPALKSCSQCGQEAMKLYRCQVDASGAWVFVCPACWPSVRYVACKRSCKFFMPAHLTSLAQRRRD